MKKIVIHAGFHKTGTTALQHSLHASTDSLAAAGYCYPIIGAGTSQSGSVLALAGRGWGWQARGSKVIPKRVWVKLVQKSVKAKQNVVLSSEFFSELNDSQVQAVKEAFADQNCEIVFTMRAFDKMFPSTYQQGLKSGSSYSYEAWLERTTSDYFSEQKTGFWKRNLHAQVIQRWMTAFGAENVTIITADESNPSLLFNRFSEVLGLGDRGLQPVENSGLNRSLLLDEVQLLRTINKGIPKSRNWNAYMTFVRRGTFEQLTSIDPGKVSASEKLRTPKAFAQKIDLIARLELAKLRELDVKVVGDLRDLEVGTAAVGNNDEPSQISIDKVAAVIASYDFGLLKLISPRSMIKNWFPYFENRLPGAIYKPISAAIRKFL